MIKNLSGNYEIDLICDLHGHSRKQNIFMYGCNIDKHPASCKLFPFILSKVSSVFSYKDSKFGVQKSKESTMRVALFKDLKIPNIFTLEASFCGADFGSYRNLHFSAEVLQKMGEDLCKALIVLSQNPSLARNPAIKKPVFRVFNKNFRKTEPETEVFITNEYKIECILHELLEKNEFLKSGEENDSNSGSESEPSEDNFDIEELKTLFPVNLNGKNLIFAIGKKMNVKTSFLQTKIIVKKCKKCNQIEEVGHICKVKRAFSVKQKVIGLRTYYNIAGKRIHDQATQTPHSFLENSGKKRYMSSNQASFETFDESSLASENFETLSNLPSLKKNNEAPSSLLGKNSKKFRRLSLSLK